MRNLPSARRRAAFHGLLDAGNSHTPTYLFYYADIELTVKFQLLEFYYLPIPSTTSQISG